MLERKIVLVASSFPKLSETFIVSKFIGLLAQGWNIHVVCSESNPAEWDHFSELVNDPELKKRVHVSWPHHSHWLAGLLLPFALLRCLVKNYRGTISYLRHGWQCYGLGVFRRFYLDAEVIACCPDLIHFEFGALAVGREDLAELLGCKEIVSFRGYDLNFSGLDHPEYYKKLWEKVNGIHLLGEDLWIRAKKRGCPAEMRHAIISPAIDMDFFSADHPKTQGIVGTPERPYRILSVGRLEWKKGYEFALQAVKMLIEKDISCEYRIIGAGSYINALAYARHEMGLDEVVHFLGAKTRIEVKSELEWADVFLHAAVSEGFCNAVIEAQSMGVPVVCSDADGLSENVENGVTGFVVPRRDPQAMAASLEAIAEQPDVHIQMGTAGRERVEERFRVTDQIGKFGLFYQKILDL